MIMFKGLHYSNAAVYNTLTFLKLGLDFYTRFIIASKYVKPGDSVLDLCSGNGSLERFLPAGCRYECVEMSPEFSLQLERNKIVNHRQNLHNGLDMKGSRYDIAVMIISLCHFRETSAHRLLEDLKNTAGRVLILEDVLEHRRSMSNPVQIAMNYLCASDYYVPLELYTVSDFNNIMQEHGYAVTKHSERYYAGVYDSLPSAVPEHNNL